MEERDNRFYIGNLLKGSGIKETAQRHEKITRIIMILLVLVVLLEIYASAAFSVNFFEADAPTRNPVLIFFALGNHPIAGIIIIAASILLGNVLANVIFLNDAEARIEINDRNEAIDNLGQYGRAKIADREELEKVFNFYKNPSDLPGTIVGRWEKTNEILVKPWAELLTDYVHQLKNDHVLVAAPSSAGKTWNVILPNLISHLLSNHSLICVDPKGELYRDIAPLCRLLGYKVRILNLNPSEMKCSDGYDILRSIREAADPESMADDICASILRNVGTGKQDFWNNANTNHRGRTGREGIQRGSRLHRRSCSTQGQHRDGHRKRSEWRRIPSRRPLQNMGDQQRGRPDRIRSFHISFYIQEQKHRGNAFAR